MCGISGLFGNDDPHLCSKMTSCLNHRGPDGNGIWAESIGRKGNISLGHTRLAIIDIMGSDQPIFSDHGCVLVQNGEIYNHLEIRKSTAYPWRTNGDGESILAAHRESIDSPQIHPEPPDGQRRGWFSCSSGSNRATRHVEWVSRLNGMWGFALWDPRSQELILCRDPMGIKPLMKWQSNDGTLLFSSEAKAFRSHPEYTPVLDSRALFARLAFEYPLDNTSLFHGVAQVRPGTIETWSLDSDGRAVLTGVASYTQFRNNPSQKWDPKKSAHELLHSLRLGLADRLNSDVPVGVVLSGGLDSSLVAALAREASDIAGKPVPKCWTVTEDEDNPDYKAAVEVSQALDLDHNSWTLDEDVFWKRLPDFSWSGEDLDLTVLFFQPLFERMSKDVKVGICGQGADEIHAGYPRHSNLSSHAAVVSNRLESIDHPIARGLSSGLLGETSLIGMGQPWSENFPNPQDVFSDMGSTLNFEMNRGQLSNFQLRLVDRHSMAHGLEVRVPFLSKQHLELSKQLPMDWRFQSGHIEKRALRSAAALTELPRHIVSRPKLPAGTATSPGLINSIIDELKPNIKEWNSEIPSLSTLLNKMPDIAIGFRLFRSLHLGSDISPPSSSKDLLDLLDDVEPLELV
ncbi:MAG TPA: asparagine synthase (glutamine-hydrolyzing) [Candidatus Thalassarchaeaceae archaeon]|mgnify:FL=1|nr:asparagine synthase (glutamine-hydrolyzing) [Candidatus Thalassarchaeaceae archaeon]